MKTRVKVLFCLMAVVIGCESSGRNSTVSKETLDKIINTQGRNMLMNGLGHYAGASGLAAMPAQWYFWPWGYGIGGVVSTDPYDTSYYDAQEEFWIWKYDSPNQHGVVKYQYVPHDNQGLPTAATDAFLFKSYANGSWPPSDWNLEFTFSDSSSFSVTGLKDFADSAKTGELVFNGFWEGFYRQRFTADTLVDFNYSDVSHNVRLRNSDCAPHAGYSESQMMQDATPDSFSYWIRFNTGSTGDSIVIPDSFMIGYEDFNFNAKIVYDEDRMHYIVDGQDYSYSTDCDSLVLIYALKKAAHKRLR